MSHKFLTWNIQAAIGTQGYHQYVTQAHRQILHVPEKDDTLAAISDIIAGYDVIALQEIDLGGRRSGFECQFTKLKTDSALPFGVVQENRVVGNLSRHGNAILSRFEISDSVDLKLPGSRSGRGVIMARIEAPKPFYAINTHLSLGEKDQIEQLSFIADNIPKDAPYVLLGDLNCGATSKAVKTFTQQTGGEIVTDDSHKTYPSWSPDHSYDHVILGPKFLGDDDIPKGRAKVLEHQLSDHRGVAVEFAHKKTAP